MAIIASPAMKLAIKDHFFMFTVIIENYQVILDKLRSKTYIFKKRSRER